MYNDVSIIDCCKAGPHKIITGVICWVFCNTEASGEQIGLLTPKNNMVQAQITVMTGTGGQFYFLEI